MPDADPRLSWPTSILLCIRDEALRACEMRACEFSAMREIVPTLETGM